MGQSANQEGLLIRATRADLLLLRAALRSTAGGGTTAPQGRVLARGHRHRPHQSVLLAPAVKCDAAGRRRDVVADHQQQEIRGEGSVHLDLALAHQ